MTPEERFRRLSESDNWTFRLTPRRAQVARRISPLIVSLGTIAAVAIVGVVVFSLFGLGIKSVRQPAVPVLPTQTETPAPSPTPTATAAELPPQSAPALLFDGDCNNVLSADQISGIFGSDVELQTPPGAFVNVGSTDTEFVLSRVGALNCYWVALNPDGSGGSNSNQISLAVIPSSALAPLSDPQTCGQGFSESMAGPNACGIEQEVSGIRFSGAIAAFDADKADQIADAVVEAFTQNAADQPELQVQDAAAGAWHFPASCDSLVDAVDMQSIFGYAFDSYSGDNGSGGGPAPAVRDVIASSGYLNCNWMPQDVGQENGVYLTASVFGGGGWARESVANMSGGEPIEIPGVSAAYSLGSDDEGDYWVFAFDGVNWIQFEGNRADFSDILPAVKPFIDALNELG